MKFDKFLAALFSRKTVAIILLVVIMALCLTACELTFEDVLCFALFGCVSFDTCREMIWACGDCVSCNDVEFLGVTCPSCGSCVGDAYNQGFNCVWESFLKDCRPSQLCNRCSGDAE